jgi:preprotein translocase subunit SecA
VDQIESLEPDIQKLTDAELRAKTDEFKQRLADGDTLNDLLPEAFAVARDAARRFIGMTPFRVQLMGGVVIHQGRIAEMRTGEGKTLVATMPLYLNALEGKGAHLVTVNDYLADHGANWMRPVFESLGLTVGVIQHDLEGNDRKAAYNCDITYATNNELGFDYLRDNMVVTQNAMVQRGLHYAIIDEVDSILIDEARTPLIISGSSGKSTQLYNVADRFVKTLQKGRILNEQEALNAITRAELQEEGDFVVDEKAKTVSLTQQGVEKAEHFFAIQNLSDPENMEIQHYINNALKANYNMNLDKDYVIQDNEIIIVDEFTGRLMHGRRYSDGLHQAIEAKENVKVNRESKTLATITFQNFFNRYEKKSGMTGTALTEEGEFRQIYGMDVVAIPTNKPMIRKDYPDLVYKTEAAKFRAVVREIMEAHSKGQPVLVGTISIEKSELISQMLRKEGVKHQVLNAKYHAKEAEIIAQAGRESTITIATNMAGRGTDIILGGDIDPDVQAVKEDLNLSDEEKAKRIEQVRADWKERHEKVVSLGGLRIIGTERHESRRIDNQLRGRAGRQGDPGESRFYISLEDDLMRLFGSEKVMKVVETLGMGEDDNIEHKMLTKAIENAQKKVEANNFGIRKHLLEYDQVMNEQREIIYAERMKVLTGQNLRDNILAMLKAVIGREVDHYAGEQEHADDWDLVGLNESLITLYHKPAVSLTKDEMDTITKDDLKDRLYDEAVGIYEAKEAEIEKVARQIYEANNLDYDAAHAEPMRELERTILLRVVDQKWMDHIDDMDQMRQGINLRAYAQKDPLVDYKFISYDMFEEMTNNIQRDTLLGLFNVHLAAPPKREPVAREMYTNMDDSEAKEPVKKKVHKIGRNEPCPCGSGLKYKQCHGRTPELAKQLEEDLKNGKYNQNAHSHKASAV